MNMRIAIIVISGVAATVLSATDLSANVQMNQSGQSCTPEILNASSAPWGYLLYSPASGIGNGSSSFLAINCPVDWWDDGAFNVQANGHTLSANEVDVYYVDSNPTNTAAAALGCTLITRDNAGNFYDSASVYSCSTAGGCPASGTPNTFSNTFSQPNFLALTPPTSRYYWNYTIECNLPGVYESSLKSFVEGYSTVYDETASD